VAVWGAWDTAPWPETWHIKDVPKLPGEVRASIKENWARAAEAIRDVPILHLENCGIRTKIIGDPAGRTVSHGSP
jgi:hypothetical protein